MYKLVRNVLVPAEQAAVPAEQAEAAEQVEVCLLNCDLYKPSGDLHSVFRLLF